MNRWADTFKHPVVVAVIVAILGLLANTIVTVIGQSYAVSIEDRRDRRDAVLEFMRSDNQEVILKKLRILNASGLLPDPSNILRDTLTDAALPAPPKAIYLPSPVAYIEPEDIPRKPPKAKLTGQAITDVTIAEGQAGLYEVWGDKLNAIANGCSKIPSGH